VIARWDPSLLISPGTQAAAEGDSSLIWDQHATELASRDLNRKLLAESLTRLNSGRFTAFTTDPPGDSMLTLLVLGLLQATNTAASHLPIQRLRAVYTQDVGPFSSGTLQTQISPLTNMRWGPYVWTRLAAMRSQSDSIDRIAGYPTPEVINRAWDEALTLFPLAMATPSVIPSDEGSVVFVWHKKGWDIEIEVDEGDTTIWARHRTDLALGRLDGRVADQRDRVVALLKSLSIT
jgi:hypothetical protein